MSARVWTREELDRVHPLPDGWAWAHDPDEGWYAVNGDGARVLVDSVGRLCCDDIDGEDADVALAVILASKGLDSREAMAAAMEEGASCSLYAASKLKGSRSRAACLASAQSMGTCAAMLRRGKVQP